MVSTETQSNKLSCDKKRENNFLILQWCIHSNQVPLDHGTVCEIANRFILFEECERWLIGFIIVYDLVTVLSSISSSLSIGYQLLL